MYCSRRIRGSRSRTPSPTSFHGLYRCTNPICEPLQLICISSFYEARHLLQQTSPISLSTGPLQTIRRKCERRGKCYPREKMRAPWQAAAGKGSRPGKQSRPNRQGARRKAVTSLHVVAIVCIALLLRQSWRSLHFNSFSALPLTSSRTALAFSHHKEHLCSSPGTSVLIIRHA